MRKRDALTFEVTVEVSRVYTLRIDAPDADTAEAIVQGFSAASVRTRDLRPDLPKSDRVRVLSSRALQ